jgi:hypothetical protein
LVCNGENPDEDLQQFFEVFGDAVERSVFGDGVSSTIEAADFPDVAGGDGLTD